MLRSSIASMQRKFTFSLPGEGSEAQPVFRAPPLLLGGCQICVGLNGWGSSRVSAGGAGLSWAVTSELPYCPRPTALGHAFWKLNWTEFTRQWERNKPRLFLGPLSGCTPPSGSGFSLGNGLGLDSNSSSHEMVLLRWLGALPAG